MARFENVKAVNLSADPFQDLSIEDALKKHIVDGIKKGLEDRLEHALTDYSPLEIINQILLDGMATVGELFGSGKMQLPFVLQSAEVMKAAVRILEPKMEKSDSDQRGSILLATVAGDVHDIGKNLVDIILSNNGYRVVNIGIKQPIQSILDHAIAERCQVIGMSGLLVKSTVIMRENLLEMNARGLSSFPVILGGAALTLETLLKD
jgi:5-methyltetrahydrofolate--homocysteine methyltransferase